MADIFIKIFFTSLPEFIFPYLAPIIKVNPKRSLEDKCETSK